MKKNLPPELVRELAGFVDLSVRNILMERTDLGAELMEDVSATVQRRMDYMEQAENETLEQRVIRLYKAGKLNDEVFGDALSMRDKSFVSAGLAALLKTSQANIDKIFAMGAAKPVVAICWKAGLSMRFALRLQQDMAKVPHKELIYPRGGTDYPLSEADLKWQLEFLGFL